jgi:hypothetical protein
MQQSQWSGHLKLVENASYKNTNSRGSLSSFHNNLINWGSFKALLPRKVRRLKWWALHVQLLFLFSPNNCEDKIRIWYLMMKYNKKGINC